MLYGSTSTLSIQPSVVVTNLPTTLADPFPVVLDDPTRWKNQPVTLQIVGRPFDDEELIEVTEVVDRVVNGDK